MLWQGEEIQEQDLLNHDPELDAPVINEIAHPENHVVGDEQPQIHDLVEEDVMNNQHMQLGFV